MSNHADRRYREEFIAAFAREGISTDHARAFLRYGATLQRLAEAQCNGDYPADNGERHTEQCSLCLSGWVPSVLKGPEKLCPDCRTGRKASALAHELGLKVELQGDPRGWVLRLTLPSGREVGV